MSVVPLRWGQRQQQWQGKDALLGLHRHIVVLLSAVESSHLLQGWGGSSLSRELRAAGRCVSLSVPGRESDLIRHSA